VNVDLKSSRPPSSMPVADQFWGDRYSKLVDPFDHHWSIATHLEDPSRQELARRQAAAFKP